MGNKLDIKIDMPTDAELERMFDAVPKLERYRVGDQVVRAGTAPIVKRARELAPRGNAVDRKKRAKTQRGAANWDIPLWKTIKRVIRKYQKGTLGVVGPEWPSGNKAYFNTSPKGRRVFYWGKDAGKTKAQIRNWIVDAAEQTRSEQLSLMKAKLKEVMDQVMRG